MKLWSYIKLFLKAYPIAKARVLAHQESKYISSVRMQICYNQVRTILINEGVEDKNITGAIIYLAISIAYLINKT